MMLDTSDKKFIVDVIDQGIAKNNEVLVKEIIQLFEVTNSRIDETNTRLDATNAKLDETNESLGGKIEKVIDMLRVDDETLKDHEKRIRKLEDKTFVLST